ncbi:hypothetical protein J437_LFUL015545, partial [Ladona fulva]
MEKWRPILDGVNGSYASFSTLCDPTFLESLKEKVEEVNDKWEILEKQLKERDGSTNVNLSTQESKSGEDFNAMIDRVLLSEFLAEKAKIEEAREAGVQLLHSSASNDVDSVIEEKMVKLNRQWEEVTQRIQ